MLLLCSCTAGEALIENIVIIIMHINVIIVHYTYVHVCTYNFILLLIIANEKIFTPYKIKCTYIIVVVIVMYYVCIVYMLQ